jgi:hypothetical protein
MLMTGYSESCFVIGIPVLIKISGKVEYQFRVAYKAIKLL